jgi:hypothetical protein
MLKKVELEVLKGISRKADRTDPIYVEYKKDLTLKEELFWSKCYSIFGFVNFYYRSIFVWQNDRTFNYYFTLLRYELMNSM